MRERALSGMPLPKMLLNRNNCIPILLKSFVSNGVVKALIFSPGVTDDFYLFNRDAAALNLEATNLWEGIAALTNRTAVRATFTSPFLFLHLQGESATQVPDLEPTAHIEASKNGTDVLWIDRHWDTVQRQLRSRLGMQVEPQPDSEAARHFYRQNVSGWNLTASELLQAAAMASGTIFKVESGRILFERRAQR